MRTVNGSFCRDRSEHAVDRVESRTVADGRHRRAAGVPYRHASAPRCTLTRTWRRVGGDVPDERRVHAVAGDCPVRVAAASRRPAPGGAARCDGRSSRRLPSRGRIRSRDGRTGWRCAGCARTQHDAAPDARTSRARRCRRRSRRRSCGRRHATPRRPNVLRDSHGERRGGGVFAVFDGRPACRRTEAGLPCHSVTQHGPRFDTIL